MRKLTKSEIDAAPGMTHYTINDDDWVYYESMNTIHHLEGKKMTLDGVDYQPIPRKEFDISDCKYLKFKHLTIMSHPSLQSSMLTIGHDRFDTICLDKNQAIEIAKLLGATSKDLS